MRQILGDYEQPLIVAAVLSVTTMIWEASVRAFEIPPFILPAPSAVAAVLIQSYAILLPHTLYTLEATLLGFGLAVILGVLCAIGIVQSRFIEKTAYTLLVSMNSLPKVAIAPIFIVWLGTGLEPKVMIAMLVAIFAIVVETVQGLKSVPPDMVALGRVLGGSRYLLLAKIQLPHALPNLFAGMKVGIALALVGEIVGEFVASRSGLGHVILVAQGQFDIPTMFAALVILAALGTVLFYVIDLVEHLVIPWHVSRRTDDARTYST
jgi:NitT/TauT family transport system permease protein